MLKAKRKNNGAITAASIDAGDAGPQLDWTPPKIKPLISEQTASTSDTIPSTLQRTQLIRSVLSEANCLVIGGLIDIVIAYTTSPILEWMQPSVQPFPECCLMNADKQIGKRPYVCVRFNGTVQTFDSKHPTNWMTIVVNQPFPSALPSTATASVESAVTLSSVTFLLESLGYLKDSGTEQQIVIGVMLLPPAMKPTTTLNDSSPDFVSAQRHSILQIGGGGGGRNQCTSRGWSPETGVTFEYDALPNGKCRASQSGKPALFCGYFQHSTIRMECVRVGNGSLRLSFYARHPSYQPSFKLVATMNEFKLPSERVLLYPALSLVGHNNCVRIVDCDF